jgi:hypothetical protein
MSKQSLSPGSFMELRYEDLVREPETVVRKICDFIEVDYDPAMLAFHAKSGDPFFSQAHHLNADKPVTDEYVGLYKMLPEADRRLQAALMGDILEELGYRVEDEPREIGPWEKAWYIEEDEHGALILGGEGVAYMNRARAERLSRKERGVWSEEDRLKHFMQA